MMVPFVVSGIITYIILLQLDKKSDFSTKIVNYILNIAGRKSDKLSMIIIFIVIGIIYIIRLMVRFDIIILSMICGILLGAFTLINPKIITKANLLRIKK